MSLPSGSSYERVQRDGSLAKQAHSAIQFGLRWWKAWREQSVNRRVFAAMVTVGAFTILVKLASAVKEVVIAYQFGRSDALDAFLMALLLPQFVIELVGGSVSSAFIPAYIQVKEGGGREAAQRLFSSVLMSSISLAFGAMLLLALLIPYALPVLASGFAPSKLELTRHIFFLLLPILLCCGLAAVWSAVLNVDGRFALGAVTPIVTPALTVFVLLLFGMPEPSGIFILAAATVVGLAMEAGLLGWGLSRRGVSLLPRWHGLSPAMRQVFSQYAPVLAGAFLMGSTTVVAQSMAAMLGPGSVSALVYGSKLTTLLLGLASVAIGTAVLPHFSKMVALKDWRGLRHTFVTYVQLIALISLPVTLLLVYFSEVLVRLFFQRGAFTEADTYLVGWVQSLYLLQVPLFALGILAVRLISALQANYLLTWCAGMNLCLNIILSYFFMKWLAVAGIALATSVMYLVSTGFLLYMAHRLLKTVQPIH